MNPFSPPQAQVEDIIPARSSITAILVGAAVGIGTPYVAGFMLSLAFSKVWSMQGVPFEQQSTRAAGSVEYFVLSHLVSFICFAPGGYWTARLSRDKPVFNAVVSGVLLSAFCVSGGLATYEKTAPLWSVVLTGASPVLGCWLGALWWRREA